MPHLLAADPAATDNQGLRWMACNACGYLLARGDTRTARDLAASLRRHWRARLGDDDENTQEAALYLAWALRDMGRYAEARDLDEDTLARRRRVLGERPPRHFDLGEQPRHRSEVPRRAPSGPRPRRRHPGPPPPGARRPPPQHPASRRATSPPI